MKALTQQSNLTTVSAFEVRFKDLKGTSAYIFYWKKKLQSWKKKKKGATLVDDLCEKLLSAASY